MAKKSSSTVDRSTAGISNPTLIDVAKVAGVSPITVSRALHRPEVVSEKAREKVLEAVRLTGYVPNMLAGGLASNKSRLVAIFVPTIAHSIFADTIQALMDRLAAAGYQALIGLTGYSAEQEEQLLGAVLGRRPDGIVLTGTLHTEQSRQRLLQAGVPVVEAWDLSDSPIDMQVGFSHEKVGQAMARHLHDRGYRHVSVISVDDPRALRRSRAVVAELEKLGITKAPLEALSAPATLLSGRTGLKQLLAKGIQPDAIVCSSDTVAQGVLAEAASQGIAVPEALAVLGFGNLSAAAHVYPPLSTVSVDGTRIGTLVAEALLQRFQGKEPLRESICIDTGFKIIDRSTT
ncbi:LacI family transcriptional regulator [Pseudomonas duriflava]|uniref:LacI family transcriptional regulator n=1 Tax=Pseudomonas duriflava TaxID=459528 RepID=A0A562QGQ6_9PSED|nr:LacI family DNA-binding transcriptional regulator [Pseudomonas duriflava]TWI55370.1 LacI family transcriptional regulator [Pseudomonas duriflava]